MEKAGGKGGAVTARGAGNLAEDCEHVSGGRLEQDALWCGLVSLPLSARWGSGEGG